EHRPTFAAQIREEYDRIRVQHGGHTAKLVSIEEARANAPKFNFDDLPKPEFTGIQVLSSGVAADVNLRKSTPDESADSHRRLRIELEELVPFIDWSPFFHTWELRGVYPKILQHEKHGEEARKLFADAQKLLEKIVSGKWLKPRAVYGLFPANRAGDDVDLYTDDSRAKVLTTFHFLRQQIVKEDGSPNWCLADFIAPKLGRESRVESREP